MKVGVILERLPNILMLSVKMITAFGWGVAPDLLWDWLDERCWIASSAHRTVWRTEHYNITLFQNDTDQMISDRVIIITQ
jgi:hypothetical protein